MLSKNEKQFKTGTLENNNNNKPTKLVTQTRARDQPTRTKPEQTLQTTG